MADPLSIFDQQDATPTPPTWRCPYCGTLQPETSRCWACSRSAVTCATCRLYRRSFVSGLGFCADDRTRTPLSGQEVRACWRSTGGEGEIDGLFGGFEHGPVPGPAPGQPSRPSGEVGLERPVPAAEGEQPFATAGPRAGLVEAPSIAPGRRLTSEVYRRVRRGRSR